MEERIITRLHNNPPEIEVIITDGLKNNYKDELYLFESNLQKESELPPAITNDDEAGKYSDYIKKLTSTEKNLDAIRKTEKEEYSSKANIVHAFFKKKIDQLSEVKIRVGEPLAAYLKKKEDEKRRIAEEKAREAAEEAARVLKEAQERERIAKEAQAAAEAQAEAERKRAEEIKRKAAEEAEAARKKAEEEANAIRAKAEEDRRAAEAEAARIAEEQRKRAETEEIGKREAAAQLRAAEEAKKAAEKAQKEAEKQAQERIAEAERKQKEAEKEAREAAKQAEESIRAANKEVKELTRDANRALDEAVRTDRAATKLERGTLAKSSELSRTRGDSSMASVSEYWIGSVESRDSLDLEALREHIPFDALERAVQSFVDAGGRSLRGAIISQEIKSVVR